MIVFPDSLLTDLRDRVDLAGLVGRRVALKKQGKGLVGLCPFHNEKTPSFGIVPSGKKFHCFGCGAHGDAIDWMQKAEGFDFYGAVVELATRLGLDWAKRHARRTARRDPILPAAGQREDQDLGYRIEAARRIWREARPIGATHAEAYLRARGIAIELPPSLRFMPSLPHKPSERAFPALVAGVQNKAGKIVGVWRIYLDPLKPIKADVTPNKMGLGQAQGCAVRLAAMSETLAVAEGIETALSVLQARPDFTVWAALSNGGFRTLALPDGGADPATGEIRPACRRVIFCTDRDRVSGEAATARSLELREQGLEVWTRTPGGPKSAKGYDFNDLLRAA